ncbi:MFS transporter [Nitratireductor pacificus]|uniref:Putative MFS transporter n=1 Tax=Nitratireductor pacificus pht-3B TaxID=391937 RepID=K2LQU0_9HYPH|nr:MFS transporter [Nitratireductor pacificus]EKF20099.1 putative MFS transporter [Nitratireductor pacificus pht-3B]
MGIGGSYVAVLRNDGVVRLVGAMATSRLTTSMLSLSLLLAVSESRDSYAEAGAVLFAHALALAVTAPLGGRLADRYGARRVLLAFIGLHALAYAAMLAALLQDLPAASLLAAAALLGGSTPPSGAIVRSTWPRLVPERTLPSAYALDTAINSGTFIIGPALVGGLILIMPADMVIGLCAVAKIAGDLLIATGPSAAKVPEGHRGTMWGALANPALILLFAIIAIDTFTIGALQVGAAASTGAAATGLLFSAFAMGEVAGGLLYGARKGPASVKPHMISLHLVTACFLLLMSQVTGLWALLALYLAAGLFGGARDTLGQLAVGLGAQPGHRTEAFGWLASFMWAGYGLGTLVSGRVDAEWGRDSLYLVAGALSVLAAVAALGLRTRRAQSLPA